MKKTMITKTKDVEVVLYTYIDKRTGEKHTIKCFPFSELDSLIQRSEGNKTLNNFINKWHINPDKYDLDTYKCGGEIDYLGIPIVGFPKIKTNYELQLTGIGEITRNGFQHSDTHFSDSLDYSSGFRNAEGLIVALGRSYDSEYPDEKVNMTYAELIQQEIYDTNVLINSEYI